MTPILPTRACRNHPARPGLGVCPSCSSVVCEECSIRVDGILHCRACQVSAVAAPDRPRWRSLSAVLPALVLLPVAWGAVTLLLQGLAGALALVGSWLREAG